jgi:hypothetical protein
VICPACSARCLVDDGFCHYCHRPLPTGPRRATFVQWGGAAGAVAATALVVLIAPITSVAGIAAALCVAIPFAFAAACFGSLGGWIVGWMVCEH